MFELFTNLFPPEESSLEQTRAWRRSVSVTVIATGALAIVNTWTMWGLWPVSLVFAGFATVATAEDAAKDIAKVQKTIERQSQQMVQDKNELKALLLLGQLNHLYDSYCGARRNGRNEEAVQWERQFFTTLVEYNSVALRPYPMRSCG